MTRRNDKRNNRRNRQRNNGNDEASKFASMMMGAIMGKAFEEVFGKKDDEDSSDIHAEGITNQDINNINIGKATLSKLRIPADGSAVEYPIPDNLQFFFDEEGKLMVRKKIEGDAEAPSKEEEKPITYDDICKKLFFDKNAYWVAGKDGISQEIQPLSYYEDAVNSTTPAQAKRYAAFNKLQNIAKYLNKGWKPNFTDGTRNWLISKMRNEEYKAMFSYSDNCGIVYFKSKCLVNEAIRLMGKESLNDLFSTDW